MGQILNFRYRGPMNWLRMYKGTLQFFRDKEFEVVEEKYKDKSDEFEGIIKAYRYVDMYTKLEYEIIFKAFDMIPMADKPGIFNGKLILTIELDNTENYKIASPAGKKVLFPDTKDGKESWIHNLYRKVTDRDRGEDRDGELFVTAQGYIEWLKEQCAMEMHYG